MASTLKINNIDTASGTTITIPTGKQVIVTDEGGLRVPGTVIQVVENSSTTQMNQGGTSFADTNLTCTITPKYSNSKVLVMVKQYFTFRIFLLMVSNCIFCVNFRMIYIDLDYDRNSYHRPSTF